MNKCYAFIQDLTLHNHQVTEEKICAQSALCKGNILPCHSVLLSNLGYIKQFRQGTSKWPILDTRPNVSMLYSQPGTGLRSDSSFFEFLTNTLHAILYLHCVTCLSDPS